LLTGLLSCGVCGGGMEVLSSKSGGHRTFSYRCYVARRKGPACCTNKLPVPMADADAAVLRAIESTLLDPRVVKKALAHAERAIARDRKAGDVDTLQGELVACEKAISRLTSAIAAGGDLPTLVTALETQERQRKELTSRLEAARAPKPELDSASVRAQLESYLTDWQGLLRGHVYQAQQILRRLIKGRLTMTPQQPSGFGRPYYAFAGCGTVRPLLGGIVRLLASPTGLNQLDKIGGIVRIAA
jgi:hypothetical protein